MTIRKKAGDTGLAAQRIVSQRRDAYRIPWQHHWLALSEEEESWLASVRRQARAEI